MLLLLFQISKSTRMGPKTRHKSGTTLSDVTGPGEPMILTELPTNNEVCSEAWDIPTGVEAIRGGC